MKKVCIGLALIAILAILMMVDPTQAWWIPKCPFKLLTGLQCPGCGCQRAVHAFLQGDIIGALRFNWFLLYAVPYLLVLITERFFLKGEWQERVRSWAENKYVVWFYIVSYFVWLVVRNVLHI